MPNPRLRFGVDYRFA
ncbi:hypothetical protein D031_4802, partial [Vibrio parahaemolyticus VP-48]